MAARDQPFGHVTYANRRTQSVHRGESKHTERARIFATHVALIDDFYHNVDTPSWQEKYEHATTCASYMREYTNVNSKTIHKNVTN